MSMEENSALSNAQLLTTPTDLLCADKENGMARLNAVDFLILSFLGEKVSLALTQVKLSLLVSVALVVL